MSRPEQIIHRQIVSGLRAGLPANWIVTHLANGGYRTKAEGGIFKSLGVLAGMPDILILGETEHGATAWFFEVKATEKGRLTDLQKAVHARLRELGFGVETVASWDQALRMARHWRLPLRFAGMGP